MGWIKDYLSFSKKERNAFIILAVIIVGFIALPGIFPAKHITASIKKKEQRSITAQRPDSLAGDEKWQTPYSVSVDEASKNYKLFPFDPNTLDEAGWLQLGIPQRTVRTLLNYRNKGGKFRKADDIRKIYSLQKEDADRILPYIRIKEYDNYKSNDHSYEKPRFIPRVVAAIDINTATVEEWKSLPGIGEVLSNRIVKFRERLGGFSSLEQVSHTYGLKDSTFQVILPYLKLLKAVSNKININIAFETDLMQCKEMTPDIAKAIVIYRKQHGPFKSTDEIKNIVFINEAMFQKIAPCLGIE